MSEQFQNIIKIEIEAKTIPIKHSHMHDCSLSLLGTGTCTSIKSVGGKLVETNTKYTLINRQSWYKQTILLKTTNKGYHKNSNICFIPWSTHRNWQWGSVKNEQRDNCKFPIVNIQFAHVAIYKQHLYMENISLSWSLFHHVWFYHDFRDRCCCQQGSNWTNVLKC